MLRPPALVACARAQDDAARATATLKPRSVGRRLPQDGVGVARAPRRRPGWRAWLAGTVLLTSLAAQPSKEYDLKAVFLYNFATFVDWPAAALPGPGQPFVIGVLGDDPFGSALTDVAAGESVHGAPLKVRRGRTLEEIGDCRVLFVSNSETPRLGPILSALAGRPILTVGDNPRFVEAGGMIGFSTGAHVQLVINPGPAKMSGLAISSKLLRVAKVSGGSAP